MGSNSLASGSAATPILGYSKMHIGICWAAPCGASIFISDNGAVGKVGWEGGCKYIRAKQNYDYETAYGHMSALALHRTGQAYSTGTGERLRRLDRPLDRRARARRDRRERTLRRSDAHPLGPRGCVLEGPVLAGFEKERERIEGIMNRKATAGVGTTRPARVAQAAGN